MEEEQSSRWWLLHLDSSAITLRETRRHTWKAFFCWRLPNVLGCVCRRRGLIPNSFFGYISLLHLEGSSAVMCQKKDDLILLWIPQRFSLTPAH